MIQETFRLPLSGPLLVAMVTSWCIILHPVETNTFTNTSEIQVLEGNPLLLYCDDTLSWDVEVYWRKSANNQTWKHIVTKYTNGTIVVDDMWTDVSIKSRASLFINASSFARDDGQFMCSITNNIEISVEVIVPVRYAILTNSVWIGNYSQITVIADDISNITCKAQVGSRQLIEFSWELDGTKLIHELDCDDSSFHCQSSIKMAFKKTTNGVRITCSIDNGRSGQVVVEAKLNVLYSPTITPIPNITSVAGSSVVIECVADGNPTPSYFWSRPEVQSQIRNHSKLDLGVVEVSQTGRYLCKANNSIGETWMETFVYIQENKETEVVLGQGILVWLLVGVIMVLAAALFTVVLWKKRKSHSNAPTIVAQRSAGRSEESETTFTPHPLNSPGRQSNSTLGSYEEIQEKVETYEKITGPSTCGADATDYETLSCRNPDNQTEEESPTFHCCGCNAT